MSKVNIKIKNAKYSAPVIKLDGKKLRIRKNKFGNFAVDAEVNDGAVLKIQSWDPILGTFWLLWEALFFVISVFGIFDIGRDKFRRAYEYEAVLRPVNDGNLTVSVIKPKGDGDPAIECNGDVEVEVLKNEYFGEKLIKRRKTIAAIVKAAAWIALIASVISTVGEMFA